MRLPLSWGKKVSSHFRDILYSGCEGMGWPESAASKLMACMAFESAETFSPSVKNMAGSSGTGLIQFMDFTAKSLGTTTSQLSAMTPEQQLRWVFKYFDQFAKLKNRSPKLSDIYMGILKPKYIGAAEETLIIVEPHEFRPNSGLDTNKDNAISKAEAAAKVDRMLEKGYQDKYCYDESKR